MRAWVVGAGAAAALCIGAQAMAQATVHHRMDDFSAEHIEYVEGEHVTILTGKVEVLQGQDRLRADLMKVYSKVGAKKGASGGVAGGLGDIERIEASGNVYMVSPTQIVRGDRAVYTAKDDTTVVTGDVVLAQGENVGRGRRLVINRATGRTTLDPDDGGRVRVVVVNDKPEDGKE
jgi:lipopolysaccharide export system protein LptA